MASLKHYLTYQHNVQRYFKEHRDKYDGVLIPFPIATAFPTGTYGFVRALCSLGKDKQYALDPRTPLFQKAWNRAKVREPHKKMAQVLGPPITTKGLSGNLLPEDFANNSMIESVTKLCIDFQLGFRTREEDEKKLKKYMKLLGLTEMANLAPPQFLIPPYFQFNNQQDPWYSVSVRCLEAAKKYSQDVPIRPVMHFQTWSSVPDWVGFWSAFLSAGVRDVWVYPNNFKEHEASSEEVKAYREAVQSAVRCGISPFALFGGYLSVLLSYSGLKGFANGVGYGEWRDSGYHKGGTAENRIYVLKLHRYLDPPLAQALLDKDAEYFGGDTDLLSECVEAKRSLETLSQAECLDHFMECRRQEIDFVTSNPASAALAEIDETLKRLEAIGPLEKQRYGASLKKWRDTVAD
jgi:hypothetical protein